MIKMRQPLRLFLLSTALVFLGCAPQKQEAQPTDVDPAILAMSSQLKAVGDGYLPESVTDDGKEKAGQGSSAGSEKIHQGPSSKATSDICEGLGFLECQPRLVRAYLMMGRRGVETTQKIVTDLARSLAGVADNTTGEFVSVEQKLKIIYNKRSSTDFDVLMIQNGIPVGRFTATPTHYDVQFDMEALEKDKPESRGGRMDIQVKFTDSQNWESQMTATQLNCNIEKPDDPENARIVVTRQGELWNAQSMFYSGISAQYSSEKTCASVPSDNTGLVIYTDLVADRKAAKEAFYVMKRTETDTDHLQNFGFNRFCSNYSDFCQSLAAAMGVSSEVLSAQLSQLQNPFCVRRGTATVAANSNCQELSERVAQEPFLENANWLSASQFYQLKISIPDHL